MPSSSRLPSRRPLLRPGPIPAASAVSRTRRRRTVQRNRSQREIRAPNGGATRDAWDVRDARGARGDRDARGAREAREARGTRTKSLEPRSRPIPKEPKPLEPESQRGSPPVSPRRDGRLPWERKSPSRRAWQPVGGRASTPASPPVWGPASEPLWRQVSAPPWEPPSARPWQRLSLPRPPRPTNHLPSRHPNHRRRHP